VISFLRSFSSQRSVRNSVETVPGVIYTNVDNIKEKASPLGKSDFAAVPEK